MIAKTEDLTKRVEVRQSGRNFFAVVVDRVTGRTLERSVNYLTRRAAEKVSDEMGRRWSCPILF